jgi:hypothetical protein
MLLPGTKPVCVGLISSGNSGFSREAIILACTLYTVFNNVIGL